MFHSWSAYVAFSRVGSVECVRIFIEDSGKQGTFKFRGKKRFTRNIVFSKVLDELTPHRREIIHLPDPNSDEEDAADNGEKSGFAGPSSSNIPNSNCESDPTSQTMRMTSLKGLLLKFSAR